MITRILADAAATEALGRAFGARARPGTFLALAGDLGAGKTTFVRGLAAGLGTTTAVRSPTFVLVVPHEGGRLPLIHADAWRLAGPEDLEGLALEAPDGVVALEWADRFPDALPADRLDVTFAPAGEGRRVTFGARGPAHAPDEAWLAEALP